MEDNGEASGTAARDTVRRDRKGGRHAVLGRVLVATAVFAPALLVLGVYLFLQDRLYSHHLRGPLWPWITADLCVLLIGVLLMRGEDL